MILVWLKLIPIRKWCYIGALLALSCAFIWFVEHERGIGEQKCEARVAAATADIQERLTKAQDENAPLLAKYNVLDQAIKNAAFPPPRPTAAACADANADLVRKLDEQRKASQL